MYGILWKNSTENHKKRERMSCENKASFLYRGRKAVVEKRKLCYAENRGLSLGGSVTLCKGGDISELQAAVRSTGLHANFRRLHILIYVNIV